jgi:hypothetical protein
MQVSGFILIDRQPDVGAPTTLEVTRTTSQITLEVSSPFSFTLPQGTFRYTGAGTLQVEARMADGSPLPAWLRFDPETGTFMGQPPEDARKPVDVVVTARDSEGNQATTRVRLQIEAAKTGSTQLRGKPSLGEQFAQHGMRASEREWRSLTAHAHAASHPTRTR